MDGQLDYSRLSASAALDELGSDKRGLSLAEAKKRLAKRGPNTLGQPLGAWLSTALDKQAHDSFFLILLAAELAAWYLGDGHIMLALGAALLLNVVANIAFLRHSNNFITHLERLLQTPVTVTRSGQRQQINSDELVLGDIVQFSQGEIIPADVRLISTEHLVTDEFNISGKHQQTAKDARIGDYNIALFGSIAIAGSASGVVIALGSNTALGAKVGSVAQIIQYTTSLAQLRLAVVRSRVGQASLALLLILTVVALATHTNFSDFLLFAIVLAVAVVPSGLTSELAVLQRVTTAPVTWIIRVAVSDVGAKLTLVSLGIFGQIAYSIPMAITVVQVVALDLVALLLPITALTGDRPRQFTTKVAARLLGFGSLSAILVYANFLFFFVRQGISPAHLDAQSTLYFHAVSLSFVTIVLCRLVNLMMVRSDHRKQFFTRYVLSNSSLLIALAFSIFLTAFVVYYPPLRYYFDSQPLSVVDWLTAILTAGIFFGLQLLQRHTRQHTRKAVIQLHHEVHVKAATAKV